LQDLEKPEDAEPLYRSALKHQEKLAEEFPSRPRYRQLLASSHARLGGLLLRAGRLADAEKSLRRAVAIQEKLIAVFPRVPDYRSDLGWTHDVLRILLASDSRAAGPEAVDAYRSLVKDYEQLATQYPQVVDYSYNLVL